MIVSFLYPLPINKIKAAHLWIFYHQLSQNQNFEFIASKEYFEPTCKIPPKNRVELIRMQSIFGFDKPLNSKIKQAKKNVISQETIDKLNEFIPNDLELFKYLTQNRCEILESELDIIFKKLLKKHDKIKAVITWHNFPSLKFIANKYKIKTINIEGGAFRKPFYKCNSAFFDFEGSISQSDFNEKFEQFKKEIQQKSIDLLEKNQILELFLALDNKIYIKNQISPKYKFGLALQAENMFPFDSEISNYDLIKMTQKLAEKDDILIRKHPAITKEDYENEGILDTSVNQIEFIQKCENIVSFHSNINLEATLFNKNIYTMRKSPYELISCGNLKNYPSKNNSELLEINFIIFCLFAPMDLLYKKEYLEFRLFESSLVEIFNYHKNYYLKNLKKLKKYDTQSRLNRLLQISSNKKICFYGAGETCKEILNKHNDKLKKLNILGIIDKLKNQKQLYSFKIYKIDELKNLNPDVVFLSVLHFEDIKKDLIDYTYEEDLKFEII